QGDMDVRVVEADDQLQRGAREIGRLGAIPRQRAAIGGQVVVSGDDTRVVFVHSPRLDSSASSSTVLTLTGGRELIARSTRRSSRSIGSASQRTTRVTDLGGDVQSARRRSSRAMRCLM